MVEKPADISPEDPEKGYTIERIISELGSSSIQEALVTFPNGRKVIVPVGSAFPDRPLPQK